jgi:MFS family permease
MFFVSSAVCATAKTMEALIIGRAFQGTAGGGLILLVHVCISDLFSMRYVQVPELFMRQEG